MNKHTAQSARLAVIRRLLQSPAGRVELDRLLGWTNALPATERDKAYAFLAKATRRQDGGANPV